MTFHDDDHDYEAEEEAARRINAARGLTDPKEREELDRVARAETTRAAMSPNEEARYREFEAAFKVEVARLYGDRLSSTITDHILRLLPLDHRAIQAMSGNEIEVPQTPVAWRKFVTEVVEGDPLARLNLEHSDAQAKAQLFALKATPIGDAMTIIRSALPSPASAVIKLVARSGPVFLDLGEYTAEPVERIAA